MISMVMIQRIMKIVMIIMLKMMIMRSDLNVYIEFCVSILVCGGVEKYLDFLLFLKNL